MKTKVYDNKSLQDSTEGLLNDYIHPISLQDNPSCRLPLVLDHPNSSTSWTKVGCRATAAAGGEGVRHQAHS